MAVVALFAICAGVATAAALSSAEHHSHSSAAVTSASRKTGGGTNHKHKHHPKKHPRRSNSAKFVKVINRDMIVPIKAVSSNGVMLAHAKRSEHQIDACAATLLNSKAGKRDGGTWAAEAIHSATLSAAGAPMTASFSRGYRKLRRMTSKTPRLSSEMGAAARYYATLQSYSGFCGAVHRWKKDGFTAASEPALFREIAASASESAAAGRVDLTVIDVTGGHGGGVKDVLVTALRSHKYLPAGLERPLSRDINTALGENAHAATPVVKQIDKWLNNLCGGGTTTVPRHTHR
jgi:hypothetical protein